MEIWINPQSCRDGLGAARTLVLDDLGLTQFVGCEVEAVFSSTGDSVSIGPRKGLKSSKRRILAVDETNSEALIGDPGEIPVLFSLERRAPITRMNFAWLGAHALGSREYLGVVPEDGSYDLRKIRLSSSANIVGEDIVEIPVPKWLELGVCTWERAAKSKKGQLYNFPQSGVDFKGPVGFHANGYGIVVTDQSTGLVLLLSKDGEQVQTAIQLPATGEEGFYGCATAEGIFLVVALNENHSAFCELSSSGEIKYQQSSWPESHGSLISGLAQPVVLNSSTVLLPHSTQGGELAAYSLETKRIISSVKLPSGSAYLQNGVEFTPECLAFSGRAAVVIVQHSERSDSERSDSESSDSADLSKWQLELLERKNLPRSVKEPTTLVTGPSQLQLKACQDSWATALDQPLSLSFLLTNSGGEGVGLEIELTGEALQSERLVPLRAQIGAAEVEFTLSKPGVFKATLPSCAVRPASERGTKKTRIEPWQLDRLSFELAAKKPGSGLLMVRVKTSQGGSAATGKSVAVS